VLLQLRNAGIRVCLLSNFSESMLRSCLEYSGLNGMFEHLLSTDKVRELVEKRSIEISPLEALCNVLYRLGPISPRLFPGEKLKP
jgi:hypothetical protein